ncbi:MAG: siroheme synthase CysG [Alphaproteobacteria bacterium]|nr:siroheme synthase CysG [Alphaproteobacteria bacterium]
MSQLRTMPVFLEVSRTPPLVAGGDRLAAAKIRTLLQRAPRVTVAAPVIVPEIENRIAAGQVEWLPRLPDLDDVTGRPLVVSATESEADDDRIAAFARKAGVPVNIPDRPELCSFAFGAMVNRGDLSIAIGTDGAAPVLATMLRARLEAELHPRLANLTAFARSYRDQVAAALTPGAPRRTFWAGFFAGPVADAVLSDDEPAAHQAVARLLRNEAQASKPGRIILVGAGPGDPELLTLKAVRAIKAADVILYDRLVGDGVLDYARREVELIEVGKRRGQRSTAQSDINELMIHHARQGKTVVRLKGGDGMIFGRAAEELEAVQSAGIPVEIVPGITAAQAASSALQLPLTSRGDVRQFSFVTGASMKGNPDLDWHALSRPGHALAVYMGVGTSPLLSRNLIAAGADPSTPVVIIESASTPNQRAISARLSALPDAIHDAAIEGPAIIFVGLDWSDMNLERPDWVEAFEMRTLPFPTSRPSHQPNPSARCDTPLPVAI